MKLKIKKFNARLLYLVFFSVNYLFLLSVPSASAIVSPLERLKSFGGNAGYNTQTDPGDSFVRMLGNIVAVLLSLLGIIFIILIIYAGLTWMTAGGDETKVTKAKDTIKRAIIGLIIIVGSFAIWKLISEKLI